MKQICIFLMVGFFGLFAGAQPVTGSISGSVTDAGNNSAVAATIRLLNQADSQLISARVSTGGNFEYNNLQTGNYLLQVSAVGYKPYTTNTIVLDSAGKTVFVSIPLLPSKNSMLADVVVKARPPLLKQDLDKIIVDVSALIGAAAGNTLEILEKTPGITIGANGEISLNGKGGVLVMINGRSTFMSSQNLAAYLKSLPGELVDKIELMENPSARYDAAGNAIINIRLKKNKNRGFSGNMVFGYSQGRYARQNEGFNINYRKNNINLFANLGYNEEENYTNDIYDRSFYNGANKLKQQQSLVNKQRNGLNGSNLNAGIDYALSSNTTVGLIINRNLGNRKGELLYNSLNFDGDHNLDSLANGKTADLEKRTNLSANVNLLKKFKTEGSELSVDLNYLNYKTISSQHSSNNFFLSNGDATGVSAFDYQLPSGIDIYSFKADYVQPFHHKILMELGMKSSLVKNNNIASYYDVSATGQQIDYSRSNHYTYSENINAAYVNTRKTWDRVSAQLGFRFETTKAAGNQLGNLVVPSSKFTKLYGKFFPAFFVSYKVDTLGINTLTLSITRRISRPNYQLLNPFVYYRDTYTSTTGNPFLDPQYQQRYELKLQHKQFLRIGLSYNRFTQSIFQITEASGNRFISKPDNIAGGYMVLLSTGLSLSPAPWWNINADILLSRVGLKSDGSSDALNFDASIARVNLLNQLRFKNGWGAEFGGYYASQDFTGQTRTSGMARVNAGIQKKLYKDKLSISLNATDIFHSWVYHNQSEDIKQAAFLQTTESDTRRIVIGVNYRFGHEGSKRKRNNTGNAAEEEKSRILP